MNKPNRLDDRINEILSNPDNVESFNISTYRAMLDVLVGNKRYEDADRLSAIYQRIKSTKTGALVVKQTFPIRYPKNAVCAGCGKEFRINIARASPKGGKVYCSKVCKYGVIEYKLDHICTVCNEPYTLTLDQAKSFRHRHTESTTCSMRCRSIKFHRALEKPTDDHKALQRVMQRQRTTCKARNTEFDPALTLDYFKELYKKQNGRCALTGIPMSLEEKNPYQISCDRIDSSRGYLRDNIQLVCLRVNYLKGTMANDDALKFINMIVKYGAPKGK